MQLDAAPETVPASVLGRASCLIPDRLYFLSLRGYPQGDEQSYFWTADHDLVYEPFEADFGPLNICMLVKFCRATTNLLRAPQLEGRRLYFYSSHDGHKRANAGYLIAAFAVLCLDYTPRDAWAMLAESYPPFLPYRDVSVGVSLYNCTIPHCLQGLHRAKKLGWVDWRRFDCAEYEMFEQPQCGDWNWIVPGKLIAFCAPHAETPASYGFKYLTPQQYAPIFRERGVSGVVRLCKRTYDAKRFEDAGLQHLDLIFPDGSVPTDAVVTRFLDFVDASPGAVAVHCKAGLGRTGTLIGCHLIKNHGFTPEAAIAWMRICRPGCVIGPQQQYLLDAGRRLRHRAQAAAAASVPTPPPQKAQTSALSPTKKQPKTAQASGRRSILQGSGGGTAAAAAAAASSQAQSATVDANSIDAHTVSLLNRSRHMQREIDSILGASSAAASRRQPSAPSSVPRHPTQAFVADVAAAAAAAASDDEDACGVSPARGLLSADSLAATDDASAGSSNPPTPDIGSITAKRLKSLRTLTSPPSAVVKTVLCMMSLLGYEGETRWASARDKLGSAEMLRRIKAFASVAAADPHSSLAHVASYVADPSCDAATVASVCRDAGPVSAWLHAAAVFCRSVAKTVVLPSVHTAAAVAPTPTPVPAPSRPASKIDKLFPHRKPSTAQETSRLPGKRPAPSIIFSVS